MSDFDYKQRPTTDAYREGIERIFGTHNCKDQAKSDLLNHIYEIEKQKLAETTEQKQPSLKD